MVSAINTYLHFADQAEEAFNFYKSIFGGEFLTLQRYQDAPGTNVTEAEKNLILHISLPIGKGNLLMASDSVKDMHGWSLKPGNNFSLSIDVESKSEADRIHSALSKGGSVTQPMADQFWGAYFGMCTDKFGIQWMIGYTPPK